MSEAPSTAVDICNLALDIIGQPTIESIDDPTTKDEELFARWYDQVRRKLLRSYQWNFAQKFETPARSGDGAGGYEDAYTYPADCLKIGILSDSEIDEYYDPDQFITEYELTETAGSGNQINVDNGGGTLYMKYTADVTNVARFDPLFIEIFSLELAYATVYQITKKKSEVERISNMLTLALPKAISVDGQERPPRRISKSKYANARSQGLRTGYASGRWH